MTLGVNNNYFIYFTTVDKTELKKILASTQQRFKNNKVYECHPDVKFLSV
jgi:hypothetical protein